MFEELYQVGHHQMLTWKITIITISADNLSIVMVLHRS